MSLRWKIFGIANYAMFIFYVFLFIGAQRFTIEKVSPEESLAPFMPFMICLLIVVFNSAFNIYVFHKYLPNRSFSKRVNTTCLVSVILFSTGLVIILFNTIKMVAEDLKSGIADSLTSFLIIFSLMSLAFGIFIIASQLKMRKYFSE